ncbi:hypothetical protein BDV95DRAFT_670242 [Massariosphaeria phaeospora]|uniref:Uncharacterized protein n=1 Tax=Massariosphaeria phaeospora TaxID=100035 RepID=A0A7C8M338_9PLEO|nr:hypothetical protein BDV95DRAFT_670242 [Massariosphaeria phaeospora]
MCPTSQGSVRRQERLRREGLALALSVTFTSPAFFVHTATISQGPTQTPAGMNELWPDPRSKGKRKPDTLPDSKEGVVLLGSEAARRESVSATFLALKERKRTAALQRAREDAHVQDHLQQELRTGLENVLDEIKTAVKHEVAQQLAALNRAESPRSQDDELAALREELAVQKAEKELLKKISEETKAENAVLQTKLEKGRKSSSYAASQDTASNSSSKRPRLARSRSSSPAQSLPPRTDYFTTPRWKYHRLTTVRLLADNRDEAAPLKSGKFIWFIKDMAFIPAREVPRTVKLQVLATMHTWREQAVGQENLCLERKSRRRPTTFKESGGESHFNFMCDYCIAMNNVCVRKINEGYLVWSRHGHKEPVWQL